MNGLASSLLRAGLKRSLGLILVALFTIQTPAAKADALDGEFEVRSAFINISNNVFLLHADVRYPVSDGMRAALAEGVSLDFTVQIVVSRERRFWLDANVVDLNLRRQLSYHSVSNRYIVRDTADSEQRSFASLEEALADIGKIESYPILTQPQLGQDAEYRVAVRASLRRGKLNDALRVILFWTNDWQRNSEWYEWSLLR